MMYYARDEREKERGRQLQQYECVYTGICKYGGKG